MVPAPARVVPVKFVAGTLAIGGGLVLGREGPSVQMGASAACQLGRLFRLPAPDLLTLLAAGAGGGFAAAFDSPIAGTVFVLEVLRPRFEGRLALMALTVCVTAVGCSQWLLGDAAAYALPQFSLPALAALPCYLLLGVGAGIVGAIYNLAIRGSLGLTDRLARLPVEARSAGVGA